jgi:hypothetical protein
MICVNNWLLKAAIPAVLTPWLSLFPIRTISQRNYGRY